MFSLKRISNPQGQGAVPPNKEKMSNRLRRRAPILAGIAVVLIIAIWALVARQGADTTRGTTIPVRRGPLVISVLESGSIKALESQQIKSEVEGQTTIITLVPEGTIITEEDVKAEKLLVELDSSNMRDRLTQQEITFQGAEASYTNARESFEIQMNQNESNIKSGELKVKFAKMDLNKYLGSILADKLITSPIEFAELANSPDLEGEALQHLGGEALQQKRKKDSDIDLANEEVKRANDRLDWTNRLYERKFVSLSNLEADELAKKRRDIAFEQAETSLELFLQYEFPKQTEKLLSDSQEAGKELERTQARARSQLAQSEAELKSREARYRLEKDKLEKLQTQIEKCVIRATHTGMVIYPAQGGYGRSQNMIEEGAMVRERQVIIEIPDISQMAVEVTVHESAVDKVKKGLPARITVDAFPDLKLEGEVLKVALMPDQQHRWLNPDLKVYKTEVTIIGNHPSIKPGMSAKCEIIVNRLQNVLSVPIQAVTTYKDQRVCYVLASTRPEMHVVETGEYNDKFIEIRSGLKEGERVLLRPPRVTALRTEQPDEEFELASETAPPAGEQQTVTTPSLTLRQAEPTTPSLAHDEQMQRRRTMSSEQGENMRRRFENMSQEQREEMRKRFENMSQEEREKMIQQFRQQRGSGMGREGRPSEHRQRGPSDERQARPRNRPQSGENP